MIPAHRRQLQRLENRICSSEMYSRSEYEQSVHAKLYCIELSGALEHMMRDCCVNYCKNSSNEFVTNFVSGATKSFPNPSAENILRIVSNFSKDWSVRLEAFWKDEIKDAVGSVVGNRHLIAHGRDCTVSVARVQQWHIAIKKLAQFMWVEIFELD